MRYPRITGFLRTTSFPRILIVSLAALSIGSLARGAEPITTRALLAQNTDLAALAQFPAPPFTCRQFSSYDRASVSPDDVEKWFANGDYNQFLRVEERDGRKEHVLMDATGPGAIVRIWSANPKGTLRVYLDDGDDPVWTVPLADLLSGKVEGVPEPLAHVRSAGWNCYLPIPYARHCKLTADEPGFYYHVNYRTYPAGTAVASFRPQDLKDLAADIEQVARQLRAPRECGIKSSTAVTIPTQGDKGPEYFEIAPQTTFKLPPMAARAGAIVDLRVRPENREPKLLRPVVLEIKFDGQTTVSCPLSDFFGAGPTLDAYESLPLGVTDDGELWSHWVMPYRESMELSLTNTGKQPVRLQLVVKMADRPWTEGSLYFHCGWRGQRDIPSRPFQDWNYVTVQGGEGQFVGAAFTIVNVVKHWWGEGDEKIYVDGEKFPSHFGTGTEDYFGYAWSSPDRFVHAYHNQPHCDGPGNYGRSSVNRWHILDRIPFTRDFRFDMEIWHHRKDTTMPEAAVATYWYSATGTTSNRTPPKPEDLAVAVAPPYQPERVAGALEGEELKVVAKSGTIEPQDIGGCSNDRHLWWRDAKIGDEMAVAFDAPQAGIYRVYARFVKANDYGIIQLSINGQPTGQPIDFYNPSISLTEEKLLGEFELKPTGNELRAEITGANEKAIKNYMFGLDYLRVENPMSKAN